MGTIRVESFDGTLALELQYRGYGISAWLPLHGIDLQHAREEATYDERFSAFVNANHLDAFAIDVIGGDDVPPRSGLPIVGSGYMPDLSRARARAYVAVWILWLVDQTVCERRGLVSQSTITRAKLHL